MRIALTLEQLWHRVPGGTGVAALGIARGLPTRPGLEVVGVSAAHRIPAPEPWRPPVEVRALPLPRPALYEAWHRLRWPPVQRATGPADVVHATSIAVPPKSAPLVVTIHDLAFVAYPELFTPRGVTFFRRGLELARKDADLVMCPSQATRRACEAAGFAADRLRVIPLGVDVEAVTERDVQRVRERYGLGRDYVLWTGTVEPRKNLGGLLEAWKRVDTDADLVLAGPAGWNEDLETLIAGMRRPTVLGFLERAELHALYAGARLLVWPSLLEGFGFPVLEAMAHGTPVVTSAGTSTEEICGDAGLVVDPRDPGAIAGAISEVLEDASLARAMGERGRRRAAAFTWKRTAESLADAYGEIA